MITAIIMSERHIYIYIYIYIYKERERERERDLRPKNDQTVAQWAHHNEFVKKWAGYWLLNELKLITMRRNAK